MTEIVQRWRRTAFIGLGGALLGATPAVGGVYVSPSVRWASFSARPEAEEKTPNYYGYGAGLQLGYSFGQVFDFGGFGTYLPARIGSAAMDGADAKLSLYGGELAVRIADSVYFALRGGASMYELVTQKRDDELTGRWRGPAFGVALGAVKRLSKQSFVQTSFELMHTIVERAKKDDADGADAGKRRLDSFGISLAYLFNNQSSYRVDNAIFQNFLDALTFW
jgi:hypothetical protein